MQRLYNVARKLTDIDEFNAVVAHRPQSLVNILNALMLISRLFDDRVGGCSPSSLLLQGLHQGTEYTTVV